MKITISVPFTFQPYADIESEQGTITITDIGDSEDDVAEAIQKLIKYREVAESEKAKPKKK